MLTRARVLALCLTVVLVGCDDAPEEPSVTDVVMPESRDEGIQATGRLDGSRVAISRGNPTVVLGDCDPGDGPDEDLCITARTIDGLDVTLVIENPAALEAGGILQVTPQCSGNCDTTTDGVVVDVVVDGSTNRVQRGEVTVVEAGPRWTATFNLQLQGAGNLIGTFDVTP